MAPVQSSPGGDHDEIPDTASRAARSRYRCRRPRAARHCRGAVLDQDRLRDLANRPQYRRRGRHHDPELRIVGEGSERRRRHQARRQARSDRGRAVRRPLQCRRGRARARAADQPGQGRFHPAAVGHRPQSGGRPDAQSRRLSAPRRNRRDRPRAGPRQALAQQLLAARHQRGRRQVAGRTALQVARRKEDRRHRRDGLHRRWLRDRPVVGGAAGAHQCEVQAGLRQELSDRHAGSRALSSTRSRRSIRMSSSPSAIRRTRWR